MNGKKIIIISLILILVNSMIVNANSLNIKYKNEILKTENSSAEWTIMIYLDADNDLEEYGVDDFLEISDVGSTEDVNIIVQFDRVPGYDSRYGDWTTTKRYLVTQDMVPDVASALMDIGEANMGDPQTLISFANWAISNYPANRYCLVFWDHGSGWKTKGGARKGVCIDETNGDILEINEIRNALSTITNDGASKIDLVGFDACLMQMIEVGYEIKDYGEYMTASEETEPATGWNYKDSLAVLIGNPTMPAEELGAQFVNYYTGQDITLSTVDLGNYNYLASVVSDFAQSLRYPELRDDVEWAIDHVQIFYDWDYADLYHFAECIEYITDDSDIKNKAQAVMNEVENTVTSEKHDSYNWDAHGISIYIPDYEYDPEYEDLLFSEDIQWDELLRWFYGAGSNPPSKPVITGPKNGEVGEEYTYTFFSLDGDGDDIFYYVEWGDYTEGEWSDRHSSGESWEASHTWERDGAYIIKAKAMDVNGAESDWSYYNIMIPKNKLIHFCERLASYFTILERIIQLPILQKLIGTNQNLITLLGI